MTKKEKFKIECKFIKLKNGLIRCKTHNQSLMYVYANGQIICSSGEDILIGKLGWEKYLKNINEVKVSIPPKDKSLGILDTFL
jgi:hypothetical protein